jgi:hypothetical protein
MEMELEDGARQDKYSAAHALALGCVLEFQKKGLSDKIAAEVVSDEFLKIWELLEVMVTGAARREDSRGNPVIPGHWLKIGVAGDPPHLAGWALDGDKDDFATTHVWLSGADAVYAINIRRIAIRLSQREQDLAAMKLRDAPIQTLQSAIGEKA